MIIKNGKEFDLFSSPEFKEFTKKYPWYNEPGQTLRIKLPKARSRDSDLEHNRNQGMRDVPNATIYPIKETLMTKKGPVTWQYAEYFDRNEATGVIININPPNIILHEDRDIDYAQADLAFFLYMSKFCGNGPNFNPKQTEAGFIVEEAEKEAIEAIKDRKLISQVEVLVLNDVDHNGLDMAEVESLCEVFHVKLNEGNRAKGENEVRNELLKSIEVRSYRKTTMGKHLTYKGYNQFLDLVGDKDAREDVAVIARAKKLGILRVKGMMGADENGRNQYWAIMDPTASKELKKFAQHFKGQHAIDHDKFLNDAIKKDDDLLELIKNAVKREQSLVKAE